MNIVSEIVMLPTSAIKPYHRNVRNNRETVDKLCVLIPKVGFNVPIVIDRNNVIVKGHTRWAAAIKLSMEQVPCVYSDADEETLKLDRIADNKVQEFSRWDMEALMSELTSINTDFDFSILDLNIEIPTLPAIMPPVYDLHQNTDQSVDQPDTEDDYDDSEPAPMPNISDKPFITPEDVQNTLPTMMTDYTEIMCNKCGNRMFIKKSAS